MDSFVTFFTLSKKQAHSSSIPALISELFNVLHCSSRFFGTGRHVQTGLNGQKRWFPSVIRCWTVLSLS